MWQYAALLSRQDRALPHSPLFCPHPPHTAVVEIGHRVANKRTASWAAVTSDPQQEHDAWTKAGGRDSLKPIRVPPFNEAEARSLLSRCIFESLKPKVKPTAEQLEAIERDYGSTLDFICGAVGTRARWLLLLMESSAEPIADANLEAKGVAVDPAFHPYLPAAARSAALRVDPMVWQQFTNLVSQRKGALKPLLEVPYNFQLSPSPLAKPGAQDAADRVLAVDAALRDLLKAADGKAAAEETPSTSAGAEAKGVSASMAFEALQNKYFRGHDADLRELCAKHVLFYNHGAETVEFESQLMRRIAASWLAEPLHKDGMQLLRLLLEWQEAKGQQAEAERQAAGWQWALAPIGYGPLAVRERVVQLEREIRSMRAMLRLLPEA
jgi:hypothetical protein